MELIRAGILVGPKINVSPNKIAINGELSPPKERQRT
jgi:hypothetical protein